MASRQVLLSAEVDALTEVKVTTECPLTGRIKQILIDFPPGTKGTVEVAVGIGQNLWLCPYKPWTYLALDGQTPIFDADQEVASGDTVWMIVRNGDDSNPHTVVAVLSMLNAT